jgi:putative ABC transport system substrate-binding protein
MLLALRRLAPLLLLVVAAAAALVAVERRSAAPDAVAAPVTEAVAVAAAPAVAAATAVPADDPPPRADDAPPAPTTTTTLDPPVLGRVWRLLAVRYADSKPAADTLDGFRLGLADAGLLEGRDWVLDAESAGSDLATLRALLDGVDRGGVDLLVVESTPALQMALRRVRRVPIVFAMAAAPFVVGAGETDDEHRANVTGVYTLGAFPEMAELLQARFPAWKRVGTVYCPTEINSVTNRTRLAGALDQHGISLVSVPARSPVELADAAVALTLRRPDVIVQVPDNLSAANFALLADAARRAQIPLMGFMREAVVQGAALAIALDYRSAGARAAAKAAAIMRGTPPARIPLGGAGPRMLLVSPANAARLGFTLPPALLADADEVMEP